MTTIPTKEVPHLYLESKHADIEAFRERDFHYSWVVGNNQLLTVEYIPENWPCLTESVGSKTVKQMKAILQEIGFEISQK